MSLSNNLGLSSALPKSKLNINEWVKHWCKRSQVHTFQRSNMGLDFFLEKSPHCLNEFHMTSQKAGVRKGDRIKVNDISNSLTFVVLEIDSYIDTPDLWIARLSVLQDASS